MRNLRWAYGVTTHHSRVHDLLPRTLKSLAKAGFDRPRLFVDGTNDHVPYSQFGLEASYRYPAIKTFGNWCLGLWELYIREPTAHRYAIFQDDLVTLPELKTYLEHVKYPEKGYLNLFTFRDNESLVAGRLIEGQYGFLEAKWISPTQEHPNGRFQCGRGAVALVFDQEAVLALLQSNHFVMRPMDPDYGTRRIDGCIVSAMNKAGFKEYIHCPSLVQHTGEQSSMRNAPQPKALTFPGEDCNAMELLDAGRLNPESVSLNRNHSTESRDLVGQTL